ncbi:hypothetical protein [Bartonella sp. SD1336NMGDW]
MGALALLGNVATLQSYYQSFSAGDHLALMKIPKRLIVNVHWL